MRVARRACGGRYWLRNRPDHGHNRVQNILRAFNTRFETRLVFGGEGRHTTEGHPNNTKYCKKLFHGLSNLQVGHWSSRYQIRCSGPGSLQENHFCSGRQEDIKLRCAPSRGILRSSSSVRTKQTYERVVAVMQKLRKELSQLQDRAESAVQTPKNGGW